LSSFPLTVSPSRHELSRHEFMRFHACASALEANCVQKALRLSRTSDNVSIPQASAKGRERALDTVAAHGGSGMVRKSHLLAARQNRSLSRSVPHASRATSFDSLFPGAEQRRLGFYPRQRTDLG
jgi:hypothetical protein